VPSFIIKIARTLRAETIDELAASVGSHRSTIQAIEANRADASLELRRKLSEHYGLPPAVLFTRVSDDLIADIFAFIKGRVAA